jgi:hypothetical protein
MARYPVYTGERGVDDDIRVNSVSPKIKCVRNLAYEAVNSFVPRPSPIQKWSKPP